MADSPRHVTSGLTDAEFIELLWRCVNLGGELMPSDMPRSPMLLEWSQAQEDATAERARRERANAGS